jgi:hypothetical protein
MVRIYVPAESTSGVRVESPETKCPPIVDHTNGKLDPFEEALASSVSDGTVQVSNAGSAIVVTGISARLIIVCVVVGHIPPPLTETEYVPVLLIEMEEDVWLVDH